MAWTPTYAHIHVTYTLSLNLLTFKQHWVGYGILSHWWIAVPMLV